MSLYLDASILVAMIQSEGDSEAALSFVGRATQPLIVSDYAKGEVASAISRRFRMGEIELSEAQDLLQAFDEWAVNASQPLTTEASDIQLGAQFIRRITLGIRMPDAVHLAAAQARGMTIVTFDTKMAMVAEMLGIETIEPR